ncbi:MAG: hypothetical protein KY456_16060, partial [Chloroflexi bacterium]|nr:hypothetical protein [Chloroflexota bacterium]
MLWQPKTASGSNELGLRDYEAGVAAPGVTVTGVALMTTTGVANAAGLAAAAPEVAAMGVADGPASTPALA